MRHMYANFQKLYKGKEYKDLMWGAASAYTKPGFDEKMEELKKLNGEAYKWLMEEKPEFWARHLYSPRSKCNRMVNNCSEGFNSWIKDLREQPIQTMMEGLRRKLMTRYQDRIKFSQKFKGDICPKIRKKLEFTKEWAKYSEVKYSRGTVFEVIGIGQTHVVDLGAHTCTCRVWDLKGIPCHHACSAIFADKRRPEYFVNQYYHTSSFLKTYAENRILPIPDERFWTENYNDPIMAPYLRRGIRRPKEARRKAEEETNTSGGVNKQYHQLRCKNCRHLGHNTRTCKGAPVGSGRGGRGRGGQGRGNQGTVGQGRGRGGQGRGSQGIVCQGQGRGVQGRGSQGRGARGGGTGRGRGATQGLTETSTIGQGTSISNQPMGRGATIGRGIGRRRGATQGFSGKFSSEGTTSTSSAPTPTITTVKWYPNKSNGPIETQGSCT